MIAGFAALEGALAFLHAHVEVSGAVAWLASTVTTAVGAAVAHRRRGDAARYPFRHVRARNEMLAQLRPNAPGDACAREVLEQDRDAELSVCYLGVRLDAPRWAALRALFHARGLPFDPARARWLRPFVDLDGVPRGEPAHLADIDERWHGIRWRRVRHAAVGSVYFALCVPIAACLAGVLGAWPFAGAPRILALLLGVSLVGVEYVLLSLIESFRALRWFSEFAVLPRACAAHETAIDESTPGAPNGLRAAGVQAGANAPSIAAGFVRDRAGQVTRSAFVNGSRRRRRRAHSPPRGPRRARPRGGLQ